MNKYDESYYLMFPDYDNEYNNRIKPTKTTANRHWYYEELVDGGAPVSFIPKNQNINVMDSGFELLFSGYDFVVTDKLKDSINLGLYGCKFYPALIQNSDASIIDNLWLLNIFKQLDCLDKKRSIFYMPEDGATDIEGLSICPHVHIFRFNEEVLDKIPENERLIFQMDKTTISYTFLHEKIVSKLKKHNVLGVKFYKISEFESGDEF